MRQRTKQTASVTSGFTIVELLVATAVTAVLVTLMITMTSGVLTAWNRTSGTLTANNQGNIVLDQVAKDLQAAVFRHDAGDPNAVALAVEILDRPEGHTPANLRTNHGWETDLGPQTQMFKPTMDEDDRSFDLKSPDIADCRYGFGGAWLRLFSNSLEGGNTVPAAVGYQVIRRHITDVPQGVSPNPAEVRYMLFRSEERRKELLESGYDLSDTTAKYAGGLRKPSSGKIIANNVIDFGVRLYVRRAPGSPPGLDPIFPVENYTTGFFNFDDSHTKYEATGASGSQPFPEVADIMVRILTEEGARQIQNLEAGRTFQNLTPAQKHQQWWDIAEANSRVFTRRIFFNARAY